MTSQTSPFWRSRPKVAFPVFTREHVQTPAWNTSSAAVPLPSASHRVLGVLSRRARWAAAEDVLWWRSAGRSPTGGGEWRSAGRRHQGSPWSQSWSRSLRYAAGRPRTPTVHSCLPDRPARPRTGHRGPCKRQVVGSIPTGGSVLTSIDALPGITGSNPGRTTDRGDNLLLCPSGVAAGGVEAERPWDALELDRPDLDERHGPCVRRVDDLLAD